MDDAKIFSCEFFPPRTEAGMEKLLIVRNELDENMHPAFYSVTFGAGGTTVTAPWTRLIDSEKITRRLHLTYPALARLEINSRS